MKDEMKTNLSCDLIRRADAIEAVIEYWDGYAKPLDSWDVMNQTRAVLETLQSAEAVSREPLDIFARMYRAERESERGGDAEMNEVKSPYMKPSPNGADLISRADAVKAVRKELVCDGRHETHDKTCRFIADVLLSALPSANAVSRDAIISAKFHPLPYTHITPADVEAESYKRGWNDALDAVADNAPSAEAEQVARKLKNPCDSLLKGDSSDAKEQKSKLDLISRELAMERIANDNVVGGMERINEYNHSTEFNEYLDGISDAITTIFCDVPSADITETKTCQKCQDVTDTILNRQGEEIGRLKSIINVLNSPSADAVQGEWKRVPTRTYKGECTNCGFRHIFLDGHDSQYRFCPNCGARMTKGGDNE